MLARVAAVVGASAVVFSFAATPASAAGESITGYTPASAPVGATIDILGSGLSGVTSVVFAGGPTAQPTSVSDGDVQVVVPQGAQSGPVNVSDGTTTTAAPTSFNVLSASLVTSVTSLVYPATAVLTTTLTSAGAGVSGQTATLQTEPLGTTAWTNGPQATTDSNGQVRFTVKPLASNAYRVAFAATPSFGAVTSNAVKIYQHPRVLMYLPTVAPILTATRVKGAVKPAQTGPVRLQRYYSGAWHTVAITSLSSTGQYVFTIKLPAKSTYTYRVRRPNDVHQSGNVSAAASVLGVNRTLRSGLSGPDVTALQHRLKALHYDVGSITGTYNFDTQHAVTAFEKVQRMSRDGVVGTAVWKALEAPRIPHLRHPVGGAAVEVDLTRQVLYYAVNGVIVRILDSSTGGGYYYTGSDGTTQRAITPTGHFAIRYKVNHWVTAKLGVLYRPAYFNYSGYAIHGEPLVPAYPASHGCVRITVPAMDRLYAKLVNGMSVWIYRS
jgi:peptidoglycan hydrolase-like protein with peptidoglycan-binding domain